MSEEFIYIPPSYPMPHSPGHERSVVSCFLNDPQTFEDVPHITEDHFHLPDTRTAFKFAYDLRGRTNCDITDVRTLMEEVSQLGLLDKLGGWSNFGDIMNYPCLPAHLPIHVEKLNQYLAKRLAIAAGKELVRSAFEDEIGDMIEAAGAPITNHQPDGDTNHPRD